jgi:hypothetical protein
MLKHRTLTLAIALFGVGLCAADAKGPPPVKSTGPVETKVYQAPVKHHDYSKDRRAPDPGRIDHGTPKAPPGGSAGTGQYNGLVQAPVQPKAQYRCGGSTGIRC